MAAESERRTPHGLFLPRGVEYIPPVASDDAKELSHLPDLIHLDAEAARSEVLPFSGTVYSRERLRPDVETEPTHFMFRMNGGYEQELKWKGSTSHETFPWLVDTRQMAVALLKRQIGDLDEHTRDALMRPEVVERVYGRAFANFLENGFPMSVVVVNDPQRDTISDFHRLIRSTMQTLVTKTGVVEISGGAAGLEMPVHTPESLVDYLERTSSNPDIRNMYGLSHAIFRLMVKYNLAGVHGGTDAGIMAGMGSVYLYDYIKMLQVLDRNADLMDGRGSTAMENMMRALEPPPIVQIAPGIPVVIPGYHDLPYQWERYGVPPAAQTVVIRGRDFGGEEKHFNGTPFSYIEPMEVLTGELADWTGADRARSRRIKMMINGGRLTLVEWIKGLERDADRERFGTTSLLLLEKTGRSSDGLAQLIRYPRMTTRELKEKFPHVKDYQNDEYREQLATLASMLRTYPQEKLHIINTRQRSALIQVEGAFARAVM